MNLKDLNKAIEKTPVRTSGISPYVELELSTVYPNPNQPRKEFKNIEELAGTIAEYGLLQPIVVERREDGYMIISGERRWRAHLHNAARTIKAYVMASSDNAIQELALIENIQREDLSDFEIAKFIGTLWASGKYKLKSDLASALGKEPPYISKAFSCLKLDAAIIADLESAKHDIGLSVLEEIGRFKDKETQREVYTKYIAGEIKRDDFVCFKPEAKVSRGKKEVDKSKDQDITLTVWCKGSDLNSLLGLHCKPEAKYRLMIVQEDQ